MFQNNPFHIDNKMRMTISLAGDAVYTKTDKGRDEVGRRTFGLNTRQRRILIVMDGTRCLSALAEIIPKQELEETVLFLVDQGFIGLAQNEKKEAAPIVLNMENVKVREKAAPTVLGPSSPMQFIPPKKMELALIQDPATVREAKDFMTTTAHTYLGLLAAELISHIERAKTAEALMTVVGQWHMALRDSKHGARFAGPYLDQITATLSGKTLEPHLYMERSVAHDRRMVSDTEMAG